MATIRMTLSAVAALVALTAIAPAVSVAQAPSAATQLQPQTEQTQTSTRAATGKKTGSATTQSKTKKTTADQTSAPRQIQATTSTATRAHAQEKDNVMRGRDTISLVAKLPWWRNDRMQTVSYGGTEVESQVMAAADAWLAANGGRAAADTPSDRETAAPAPADEVVADADEVNDIDLAAKASVPAPSSPAFLKSLLAILGGAAVAAASARFLFT